MKPRQYIKMLGVTKCRKDCKFHTILIQAYTRRTLYSNVVNGLNSLVALQNMINGCEMPGWVPMNEDLVKTTIENNTLAYIRSNNDVRTIKETLRNGCTVCQILLPEIVQIEEQIAEESEEAVLNFLDKKDTK